MFARAETAVSRWEGDIGILYDPDASRDPKRLIDDF